MTVEDSYGYEKAGALATTGLDQALAVTAPLAFNSITEKLQKGKNSYQSVSVII
jgi:hypothetical protein